MSVLALVGLWMVQTTDWGWYHIVGKSRWICIFPSALFPWVRELTYFYSAWRAGDGETLLEGIWQWEICKVLSRHTDCASLCTTEAGDCGCKTTRILQPPFLSSWSRGVGKANVPHHSSSLSLPQVHRARLNGYTESSTLQSPPIFQFSPSMLLNQFERFSTMLIHFPSLGLGVLDANTKFGYADCPRCLWGFFCFWLPRAKYTDFCAQRHHHRSWKVTVNSPQWLWLFTRNSLQDHFHLQYNSSPSQSPRWVDSHYPLVPKQETEPEMGGDSCKDIHQRSRNGGFSPKLRVFPKLILSKNTVLLQQELRVLTDVRAKALTERCCGAAKTQDPPPLRDSPELRLQKGRDSVITKTPRNWNETHSGHIILNRWGLCHMPQLHHQRRIFKIKKLS